MMICSKMSDLRFY